MTELNLREQMTDTEKAALKRGATLETDIGCLVEMADCRVSVIDVETEEDAKSWKIDFGYNILILQPNYRVVSGSNPTGRYGKDKFVFALGASGDVEEGYKKNDMVKGILSGVLRAFFGGKDKVPDLDPVHIMVNKFDLVQGLQARCDITQGESEKGTQYNNFKSWKIV